MTAPWHNLPARPRGRALVTFHAPRPYGDVAIGVDVVSASDAVRRGLAGRPSLDPFQGMLFALGEPRGYPWRFTTVGMRFPLDLVTINTRGQVTFAVSWAHPGIATIFTTREPWVVEMPAGTLQSHRIGLGTTATIVQHP